MQPSVRVHESIKSVLFVSHLFKCSLSNDSPTGARIVRVIVHNTCIDADKNADTPILILTRKILSVSPRLTSGHSPVLQS